MVYFVNSLARPPRSSEETVFMQKITALILIGLLLAGCASAVQYPPVDRKTPIPRGSYATQPVEEPTAAATPIISELPTAASTAQAELAQLLGVDSATVSVLAVETRQWPDACLGLANQAEVCAQQITEGYQIVMQAVGAIFTMRTNQDGSQVRIAYPSVGDPQAAVQVARAVLAGLLGLSDPSQVALVQVMPVEWLNACLGVVSPDIACAEVITPGFRILLEAQGVQYEFHANQDGSQILQMETP
jgi:hypothetical protein